MKIVDDILLGAGLYAELLKLIDQYDGDTHIDIEMKQTFTRSVIQPLHYLHEAFVIVALQECGRDGYQWPVRAYLNDVYHLTQQEAYGGTCRINRTNKTIESCLSYLTSCNEFLDPQYQRFNFYATHTDPVPSGFKCIVFD